jgi:hypothetical protein
MYFNNKTFAILTLCGSFIVASLFLACTNKVVSYRGRWVDDADRIALQEGGPHKGSWQTRDVIITYEYVKDAQNLQISGVVELSDHLKMGFSTLEYMNINVISVENGFVLDSKDIKTFGYRRYMAFMGKMTFETQLELSQGAVAVSFSYSGTVMEGGGRGDWRFWKVPSLNPPQE